MDKLTYLLRKYLDDDLTASEMEDFLELVESVPDYTFMEIWTLVDRERTHSAQSLASKERVKGNILKALSAAPLEPRRITLGIWWKVAAAILLMTAFSYVIYNYHQKIPASNITMATGDDDIHIQADAIPKVQINGEEYPLHAANSHLLHGLGVEYRSEEMTHINLTQIEKEGVNSITISTPKGQISHVTLPDGSQVWLNSHSQLVLSKSFSTAKRSVHLEGEAYFEVFPQRDRPFAVETSRGTIQVLGTHFNVSAYPKAKKSTVTLSEGAVRVFNSENEMQLKPGFQAVLTNQKQRIYKREVDVQEELSWMSGYYHFNELRIEEILHILQQWYDIESIDYQANSDIQFSGHIRQSKSLRQVLDNLEKISDLKFHIKERRLVVIR